MTPLLSELTAVHAMSKSRSVYRPGAGGVAAANTVQSLVLEYFRCSSQPLFSSVGALSGKDSIK